jgi:N2227-like protein
VIICPRCAVPLGRAPEAWSNPCDACGAVVPVLGGLPCLFPDSDAWLVAWRRQLRTFDAQVRQTWTLLAEAQAKPGLLPATHRRLQTFRAASETLLTEVHGLLDPLLHPRVAGAAEREADVPDSREARPLTHYLDLVYRDWAWETDERGEVALGLAELEAVAGPAPLGRGLILGAGACRLAYELHRAHRTTETFALDVDILLMAAARLIISGERLLLTEAPTEANDLDTLSIRHELVAPGGPLTDGSFHLLLANGLEPPFANATFDTIITPWFIDVASSDLRSLAGTIHRLLAPGGRWLNLGPLVYTHRVPFEHRYTAQEAVEVAQRAGFTVGEPRLATVPYTLSPLNGRGRLERILAFAAIKE